MATLCGTAQAATVNGWGHSSDAINGTTITDSGSGGNFNVSITPTGNSDWRASIPTVSLNVGDTLTFSGSFNFATSGSMGGAGLRIGLLDFGTLGTLTGTTWSTTAADTSVTGYFWGLPTGGNGVSNPGGGEITRKPTGANNAWFSGTGGTAVSGTLNNNAGNITPNTYNFSLSLLRTIGGVSISYSMVGGSYSEVLTGLSDTAGIVPLTFNSVGFFGNTSDTAFGAPGGVSFNSVDVTFTPVPEPSTAALLGLSALLGTFVIRRRK